MSNLKFTLHVKDTSTYLLGYSLMARVFDLSSLLAVHRAIQNGCFGHYAKRRYYLVPLSEVRSASEMMEYPGVERSYCSLESKLQLYPKGGRQLNADVLALFSNDALTR